MTPTFKAVLWMIGALTAFSTMAVAGRELDGRYDTFEIMMYRSIFGLIIVLAIGRWAGTLGQINRDALGLHVVRNLVHFTGQNLWFAALTLIPLAQLFAFEFTTPIWVILLSPFLLKERLSAVQLLAALLGFIGILIVARPTVEGVNIGMLVAASCAVFFALTFITTKKLTKTQSITAIMFYLTLLQMIFGIVAAGIDGDIKPLEWATLHLLVLIGLCGLLAHFCIGKALSLASASIVAPVDFIRLPVIAVVAMLLYNEPLDVWVFVGAAIIFGGNYLNIWHENRKVNTG